MGFHFYSYLLVTTNSYLPANVANRRCMATHGECVLLNTTVTVGDAVALWGHAKIYTASPMVCSNPQVTTMKILRIKQVIEMTTLGRSTIYKYIKEGTFPKQIKMGARASGWLQADVENWILTRRCRDQVVQEGRSS